MTGGWNFGIADVGLAYETMTYKTVASDCDATQMGIGFAIPIGSGFIRGSYSVADDIEGTFTGAGSCGAATALGETGAKQWNLGYEHRFSKRTTVGFGYAVITNEAAAVFTWSGAPLSQSGGAAAGSVNPPAGSDPSTFFVSIIHRF
ncbi:MAG: porin [Burkholderiales bacterium]